MFRISLHGSSFVGSRFGYQPSGSWEQCVEALTAYYQPIETFLQRFDALLDQVQRMGFQKMDVWQPAVLNWQWATSRHIEDARSIIENRGMEITSLAGEFGVSRAEFDSACRLAHAIGTPLLSGTTALLSGDRSFVIETLKRYDLRLAIENEVETAPAQILEQIGENSSGWLGAAVDTGWWATHNYDVVQALHELKGFVFHVHLKDVLPGPEHINCGYGKGCVPIADCVRALIATGYSGVVSLENHSLDHDPTSELIEGKRMLEELMASTG